MPKRTDALLLKDIFTAMSELFEFVKDISFEAFMVDAKTKAAVIRNLEVIGEAAKLVSEETKITYKIVEWKEMAALRNKLIHEYFGIDYMIVWNVLHEDIPYNYELIKSIITPSHTK
jgi:uncharacterized protein with HEPN domain